MKPRSSENLPGYGREIGRAVSYGALVLCTDLPREKKEKSWFLLR
jgi:hypothetical protein